MTNQEAIDKMEFCKRAYQRMIDENLQEGVFVGKGFEGKWKADTPLYKVYEDMRDACDMSIKALENIGHLKDRPCDVCEFHKENGCCKWDCVFEGV